MKTIIGLLFTVATVTVFNQADAQRGRDGGGRGRESNTSSRESSRSFSEGRSFHPSTSYRSNNSFTPTQRNARTFTPRAGANNSFTPTQRNAITRNDVRVN